MVRKWSAAASSVPVEAAAFEQQTVVAAVPCVLARDDDHAVVLADEDPAGRAAVPPLGHRGPYDPQHLSFVERKGVRVGVRLGADYRSMSSAGDLQSVLLNGPLVEEAGL